jgi:dTDP-4-amino-4,6-dideoxygalactose transaminase
MWLKNKRPSEKEAGVASRRIPFGTVTLNDTARNFIQDVLHTERFSSGKYVRAFEEKFAQLTGTAEAVAVSSGTDADALAVAVLYDFGARRGDEVIVPALSFAATGNAILQAGFTPVFVDIDSRTLNIDPAGIERAITRKTRAIMPVHLMGKPAPMDEINAIARAHGLYVIEDAAEAHGAVYKGHNAGSLGDMGAFSLYVAHIITTIEGGIVTTSNEEFARVLRSLRSHGRACTCKSCVLNLQSRYCEKRFGNDENQDMRFMFERIGFSTKMNEFEAAIGLGSLEMYDTILRTRRRNLYYLMEQMRAFAPHLLTITKEAYEEIGPHALPIIVAEDAPFSRNGLTKHMEEHGIDTRTLFSSMPTQCPGFAFLGYKVGNFPQAEFIGTNGIHIGVHQDITQGDCDYIIDVIRSFLRQSVSGV